MVGSVEFTHLSEHDIYVATPRWHVATEEDVFTWYRQYEEFFLAGSNGKEPPTKVDVIFDLREFRVATAVASLWGEHRSKLINRYTRHSYRINVEAGVSLFMATTAVRFNAVTAKTLDLDAAIKAILDARERAATPR